MCAPILSFRKPAREIAGGHGRVSSLFLRAKEVEREAPARFAGIRWGVLIRSKASASHLSGRLLEFVF